MYTQILYPCALYLTSYDSEEIDKITRKHDSCVFGSL